MCIIKKSTAKPKSNTAQQMKFSSSTYLAVLAAGLSAANAFVPAVSSFSNRIVVSPAPPPLQPQPSRFATTSCLNAADPLKVLELLDDFDPDEGDAGEEDDEKTKKLLEATTFALEKLTEDGDEESPFAEALKYIKVFGDAVASQKAKSVTMEFSKYDNHPEVSFFCISLHLMCL